MPTSPNAAGGWTPSEADLQIMAEHLDLPRDPAGNPDFFERERLLRTAMEVETAGIVGDETRGRTEAHYQRVATQDLTRLGEWFENEVAIFMPTLSGYHHEDDCRPEAERMARQEFEVFFLIQKAFAQSQGQQ